jgi:hypothetical protein
MTKITNNVGRTILNGTGGRTTEGQESQLRTQASPPTLQRAVVVDVITSPAELTEEYLNELANLVNNAELLEIMPVNSVIARIVSNNGGVSPQQNTILFPLFSSHIMLPIKPGEHVYAIFEDSGFKNNKLGFWISRPTSPLQIEDPNYTHYDRLWDPTTDPANYSTGQTTKRPQTSPAYSFQNGGGSEESVTLSNEGLPDKANPYDVIVKNADAAKSFVTEPVPRWKKRPGELVLQGSNNSLIVLGTDRNAGLVAEGEIKPDSAAVDIVVGRGRHKKQPGTFPDSEEDDGKYATAPIVANNIRADGTEGTETDKAPHRSAAFPDKGNVREGDPSPKWDAARVLVTQQANVDENYGISAAEYPPNALKPEQPEAIGPLGRSYVVSKADHVRTIARGDDDVKGTVLIIKEGEPNGKTYGGEIIAIPQETPSPIPSPFIIPETQSSEGTGDLAYILADDKGKIQIEGNKIYLGQSTGEADPFVRWTYYNAQIESLKQQIQALANMIQTLSTAYDAAFASSVAVPFVPVPSLFALANAQLSINLVKTSVDQINTNLSQIRPEDAKSKKIFGE